MGGLARLCKLYGKMVFKDKNGKETVYVYDYVNDKPRIEGEMTKEEWAASEKAKWETVKSELKTK